MFTKRLVSSFDKNIGKYFVQLFEQENGIDLFHYMFQNSTKLLAISYHTLISIGLGKLNNKGARTAVATVVDLGSVSKGPGLNFINVLSTAFKRVDPESIRIQSNPQYLFTLLGSMCTKAVCRTLMKLTPGGGTT